MKTPDEIKNGLEHCAQSEPCVDCVYDRRDFPICVRRMEGDALAYIQQLEAAHRTEYCDDADYDCKRLGDARKRIQQLEHHIGELTEKVAQLEAAQLKWISVEERLPDDHGNFLTKIHCFIGDWIEVDTFDHAGKVWWHDTGNRTVCATEFVTHWMPLPSMPEPQKEEA